MAEMTVDLFKSFDTALDDKTLFRWHSQMMLGREEKVWVGAYRTHDAPMQVVSGPIHAPKVHFEAPPSVEMARDEHFHPVV